MYNIRNMTVSSISCVHESKEKFKIIFGERLLRQGSLHDLA